MLDILSQDGKTYPETVQAAREAAERLKQALESKILGREFLGVHCRCGYDHSAEAKAVEICPAGSEFQYRDQIASWQQWTVKIEHLSSIEFTPYLSEEAMLALLTGQVKVDDGSHISSIDLSFFLSKEEIEALFDEHFKDIDTNYLNREKNGKKLRAKGKRIDIAEGGEVFVDQGKSSLAFHIKYSAHLPELAEIRAKVEENELYLALIGAIHSSKGGDVISVPEDEMRVFAHKYMAFARLGGYLLFECGDTVSLEGIIQNVRRKLEKNLDSRHPLQIGSNHAAAHNKADSAILPVLG